MHIPFENIATASSVFDSFNFNIVQFYTNHSFPSHRCLKNLEQYFDVNPIN